MDTLIRDIEQKPCGPTEGHKASWIGYDHAYFCSCGRQALVQCGICGLPRCDEDSLAKPNCDKDPGF